MKIKAVAPLEAGPEFVEEVGPVRTGATSYSSLIARRRAYWRAAMTVRLSSPRREWVAGVGSGGRGASFWVTSLAASF